jgi:hypothetical protein
MVMTQGEAPAPKIVADVLVAAEWMSHALCEMGYLADFSVESLHEVDRFFDEQAPRGKPVPGGLLSEGLGARLFGLGAYVGEVIRRVAGGAWQGDDTDPQAEVNVGLQLGDGSICWPVQRIVKRLHLGKEESVAGYGAVLTRG